MPIRRTARRQTLAAGSDQERAASAAERLRPAGLAAVALLLVAMPLLPSEGDAETGSGSVLILAWLGLAAAVVTGHCLRGAGLRLRAADAAVLALLAWLMLSGWVMSGEANPRATINASWQWLSFGAVYVSIRQLVRRPVEQRALGALLVGLAAGLAALGCYQFFYSMPQLRAAYEADPERILRAEGIDAPPGSPERTLFENRLYSSEPMGTFALANSLAGLLAPWLVAALGIGLGCWVQVRAGRQPGATCRTVDDGSPPPAAALSKASRPGEPAVHAKVRGRCLAAVAIGGALIGFCLLLTKSRTAVLATALGVGVLAWMQIRGSRRIGWRIPLGGLLLLAILAGGAIGSGAFDVLVVSEAPKSLLYRFEYWQATLAMVRDRPWFGCGAGNFQQYYASYKLPQASEMVADPHNFLLEVWAIAGTPAAVALVTFLILVLRRGWSDRGSCPAGEGEAEIAAAVPAPGEAQDRHVGRWIWGGGLAGAIAAFPLGVVAGFPPPAAVLWLGLPAAAVVIGLLRGWTIGGGLPSWLLTTALAVLLLNLSAAGGIGFPGVSMTVWILAALLMNRHAPPAAAGAAPAWARFGLAAAAWVLVIACHRTMYAPVLTAQARLGEGLGWAEQGRWDQAEAALQAAAQADRYAAKPWMHLAALYHRRLLEVRSPENLAQFEEAVRQAQRRDRRAYTLRRQAGNWRLALYRRWEDPEQLSAAIEEYRQWADIYPASSAAFAQLAWCHAVAGQPEQAAEYATEALRLDTLNPHGERKLLRHQVFEPEQGRLPAADAEQLMRQLRSGRVGVSQGGRISIAPPVRLQATSGSCPAAVLVCAARDQDSEVVKGQS